MEKVTKKEMYNRVLKLIAGNETEVEFINYEIELLEKRNKTKKKVEEKPEKIALRAALLEILVEKGVMIAKDLAEMTGESTQTVAAQLKKLVAQGYVKAIAGKVNSYTAIEIEEN